MPKSPTARTIDHFRDQGIPIYKTETWNYYAKRSNDLFGFIDAVALTDTILGLQITSGVNTSARVKKILHERTDNAIAWLEAGGTIEVWGWRQLLEKRGGKRKIWEPKIIEITLDDF